MVNCANCGKKIKWGSEIEFDKHSIETKYDEEIKEEIKKIDKSEHEEPKTVCKNCYEELEEKEFLKRKKIADKIKTEKHKNEFDLEKGLIKEYGGKFQAHSIKELIEISLHLKKIRSYIGWILAIIVIGIIITLFSSFKVLT